jgi:hypothetical protein
MESINIPRFNAGFTLPNSSLQFNKKGTAVYGAFNK